MNGLFMAWFIIKQILGIYIKNGMNYANWLQRDKNSFRLLKEVMDNMIKFGK